MADDASELNARIFCDLSPLGLGQVECNGNVNFGPADDPESLLIEVPASREKVVALFNGRSLATADYLGDEAFTGVMQESQAEFEGRIACVNGFRPVGLLDSFQLTCALNEFHFRTEIEDATESQKVIFRVTNVPQRLMGDVAVARPVTERLPNPTETDYFHITEFDQLDADEKRERMQPGWQFSRSRINFTYGDLAWNLDTTGVPVNKKSNDTLRPIVTATLATDATEKADLSALADQICDLLTLGFGREVRWVSCGRFTANRHIRSSCRSFPLLPYGKGAGPLVDNWEFGNLQQFVEQCEPVYLEDTEWWHRSIGLLTHARATSLLEIRLATLNILVDRVSSHVIGASGDSQIDEALPARLEDASFEDNLHNLLSTLSPNWDAQRTQAVCNQIKMWNSRPSFPNQVIQGCEALGINAPTRKQLGLRHKLMHAGEFDKRLKTPRQMVDYLQGLEAVVELMMIRLLGFTGYVHIDERGPDYQLVESLLSEEDQTRD